MISQINSKFNDYGERIYTTTHTVKSASYLDLHLEIDMEGQLEKQKR